MYIAASAFSIQRFIYSLTVVLKAQPKFPPEDIFKFFADKTIYLLADDSHVISSHIFHENIRDITKRIYKALYIIEMLGKFIKKKVSIQDIKIFRKTKQEKTLNFINPYKPGVLFDGH